MPKMTSAEMKVDEALRMREMSKAAGQPDPEFTCPECGKRVQPHAAGGHTAAHFEHDNRNPKCNMSDPAR